eukprot:6117945-Ditylum_brightwellii.AAC.1
MGTLERYEIFEYHDAKHNPQIISVGRQDLVMETKAVIMQGNEAKLITNEAKSMIQEETSMT